MSIAALVRSMAAAGASPEVIALAVDAVEAVEAKIETGRALARERKRRQRAAASNDDGDVTGQSRDTDGTVTSNPSLDKEKSPRPSKEIKPIPGGEKRARATRIREGWVPSKPLPPNVAQLVAQWPPGREGREFEGFVDYWTTRNRDAARTDWDLVWHNRIRDQHDRIMRETRNGRQLQTDQRGNAGLRGSRPDPSFDIWQGAVDEIAAASEYPQADRGTWLSLPAERSG